MKNKVRFSRFLRYKKWP